VRIAGCRAGVGVAHPLLELAVALGGRAAVRAEGMAEVVEAEGSEAGGGLRPVVPPAEC